MTDMRTEQDDIVSATSANTAFSKLLPGLQLAWDSTSIGAAKKCARYYQYEIVLGFRGRGDNVHLTFGIIMHKARELYDHAKCALKSHDEAVLVAVVYAMKATWIKDGLGERQWDPSKDGYDGNKSRETLIRSIVWYLDKFERDPLQTIVLASGKPAVELSFRFSMGLQVEATGEQYQLCGHMDRLASMNGVNYIVDLKTTEGTIGSYWFDKFNPHNQFSTYLYASQIVLAAPVRDLIVDGIQVAKGFTRPQRGIVHRDAHQLDEWFGDVQRLVVQYERYAVDRYWPMNDIACDLYGGCKFRGICSKSPGNRMKYLKAEFKQQSWDPLAIRGDV